MACVTGSRRLAQGPAAGSEGSTRCSRCSGAGGPSEPSCWAHVGPVAKCTTLWKLLGVGRMHVLNQGQPRRPPVSAPGGGVGGGCVQLHGMETIVGYTGQRSGETQRSHPHFLHRCRVREMSEVGDEARHRWTGSGSQQLLGRRGCRHTPTPGCETQLGHLGHRANGRSGEDALPCGCLGVPGLLSAPR